LPIQKIERLFRIEMKRNRSMAIQQADYLQAIRTTGAEAQLSSSGHSRIAYIRAMVSGLDYPMVPFAVLKDDPRPAFQQWMEAYQQAIESQENTFRAICESWNRPFVSLKSEQLFFVCAWDSVPKAPPLVVQASGLIFGIATPGPHRKRWCTTRGVTRQGELVAWCCEIDMSEEACRQVAEVVFSEKNMLRLVERQ
jgi:hypothetical protein